VMKRHGEDPEVARHCCRIIHGVSGRTAENVASLCKAGVVCGLNALIDYHLANAPVQECSTQALEILSRCGDAREIIATGGFSRLLNVMTEHRDNLYIQRSCWSCLDLLIANAGQLTNTMREEVVAASEQVTRATGALVASNHPADKLTRQKAEKLVNYVQNCVRQHKTPVVVAQPRKKEEVVVVEATKLAEQEELDLRAWLLNLDQTGALAHYQKVLAENFDSVFHILDVYVEDGRLDPQFFEDVGVTKLGHRRKFEQWFQRYFEEQRKVAVAASGTAAAI